MNGRWPSIGIPRAAAALWTPMDDPGLEIWWDVADASTFTISQGSQFSEWRSKGSLGLAMNQGNLANQTSYTGGLISINALTRYGASAEFVPQGKLVVSTWNAGQFWSSLFARGVYAPAFYMRNDATGMERFPGGNYGSVSGATSLVVVTLPNFCSAGAPCYHTGTQVGTYSGTEWGANGVQHILWDGVGSTAGVTGDIVVSASNDQATREKYEGFMAHRFSLAGSLPGGHPYKAAPPTQ